MHAAACMMMLHDAYICIVHSYTGRARACRQHDDAARIMLSIACVYTCCARVRTYTLYAIYNSFHTYTYVHLDASNMVCVV